MKRYIITGAPGTGKTSLIRALKCGGYHVFDEISRKVIQDQQQQGGNKTPWGDVQNFTKLVYKKTVKDLSLPIKKYAFVDRGLADNIAYLKYDNQDVYRELRCFNYKKYYNTNVFILPIWEDIYVQDNQRLQTFEQAKQLHNLIIKTYQELGFTIHLLPKCNVKKRLQII